VKSKRRVQDEEVKRKESEERVGGKRERERKETSERRELLLPLFQNKAKREMSRVLSIQSHQK